MSSATTALLSRFMSTLLMVAFLARSSSSSLTLLATACKQPPQVIIVLTLENNNVTMLESVIISNIVTFQHGKQTDAIGRECYDSGRQCESQSGDWQQITECVKIRDVQHHSIERVDAVIFYAFHVHNNHSFAC